MNDSKEKTSILKNNQRTENELENQKKFRKIKMGEIMKLYTPKSMILMGIAASIVVSVSMPIFGLLVSKYIFALQAVEDT